MGWFVNIPYTVVPAKAGPLGERPPALAGHFCNVGPTNYCLCRVNDVPVSGGHLPRGATFPLNRRWPLVAGTAVLASALLRIPPLTFASLPCSLPSSLNPSSACFLPPSFSSRRPCLVPSLPRSFPSSTIPSSTDALSLPSIIASSTCSLPPFLAPSLPPPYLPGSACLPPSNSMYTVCVCLASCIEHCLAPSDAWHWDNGVFRACFGPKYFNVIICL